MRVYSSPMSGLMSTRVYEAARRKHRSSSFSMHFMAVLRHRFVVLAVAMMVTQILILSSPLTAATTINNCHDCCFPTYSNSTDSLFPAHIATVGTCVNSLLPGQSCSITCANGFYPNPAQTTCEGGELSEQSCAAPTPLTVYFTLPTCQMQLEEFFASPSFKGLYASTHSAPFTRPEIRAAPLPEEVCIYAAEIRVGRVWDLTSELNAEESKFATFNASSTEQAYSALQLSPISFVLLQLADITSTDLFLHLQYNAGTPATSENSTVVASTTNDSDNCHFNRDAFLEFQPILERNTFFQQTCGGITSLSLSNQEIGSTSLLMPEGAGSSAEEERIPLPPRTMYFVTPDCHEPPEEYAQSSRFIAFYMSDDLESIMEPSSITNPFICIFQATAEFGVPMDPRSWIEGFKYVRGMEELAFFGYQSIQLDSEHFMVFDAQQLTDIQRVDPALIAVAQAKVDAEAREQAQKDEVARNNRRSEVLFGSTQSEEASSIVHQHQQHRFSTLSAFSKNSNSDSAGAPVYPAVTSRWSRLPEPTELPEEQEAILISRLPYHPMRKAMKQFSILQENMLAQAHLQWVVHLTAYNCLIGSYPANGGWGSCVSSVGPSTFCDFTCNDGFYLTADTICPAGGTTLSSLGSCAPCNAGCFCSGQTMNSCQNQCPAGAYCGLGADGFTNCAAGTWSTAVSATSSSTCSLCSPGNFCLGGSAIAPCDGGCYCTSGASSSCQNSCVAGTYCPPGSSGPITCPQGSYCLAGASAPTNCAAGKTTISTGATSVGFCSPNCFAGSYCPGDGTMPPCPPGYFCPPGSSAPQQCGSGTYCSGNGATGTPCNAGTWSTALGQSSSSTCAPCSVGSYCTGGANITPCNPGTYGASTGLTFQALCSTCSLGNYCTGGASVTPCPAGSYGAGLGLTGPGSCSGCPGGSSCSGGSSVVICPAGAYCAANSAAPTYCTAGTYSFTVGAGSIGTCNSCEIGYYCTGGSNHTPCPAGSYGSSTGATSSAACTICPLGNSCLGGSDNTPCPAGSYGASTGLTSILGCSNCQSGYYCSGGGSSTQCGAGTVSLLPGQSSPSACQSCTGGFYCAGGASMVGCSLGSYCPAGSSSETPCPPGAFCFAGVLAPTFCSPGTYSTSSGQSSSSTCVICPIGSYCNGATAIASCPSGTYGASSGLAASTDCTTCAAGNSCAGGTDNTPCAAGSYGTSSGQSTCTPCPAGLWCSGGSSFANCPAGAWCATGVTTPTLCVAGTWSTSMGQSTISTCATCSIGSYCVGSSSIASCPAGTYGASSGLTASTSCTTCPLGNSCQGGIDNTPCPAGTYGANAGLAAPGGCTTCEPGKWCSGGAVNTVCSAGTWSTATSASSSASCTTCTAGSWCSGGASIVACVAGTWSTATSATSMSTCAACVMGSYCNGGAATNLCPAGTVGTATGLTTVGGCSVCGLGSFCSGGTNVATCAAGSYGAGIGLTAQADCNTCPLGNYCLGSTGNVACPAGTYGASTGLTSAAGCSPCPLGNTCAGGADNKPCTAGSYGAAASLTSPADCTSCPANSYCVGGSSITACAAGTWSIALKAKSPSTCVPSSSIVLSCSVDSSVTLVPLQVVTCSLTPDAAPVGSQLDINLKLTTGIGILSTSILTFVANDKTSRSFTFTAPSLPSASLEKIHFSLTNLAAPQFLNISRQSYNIQAAPSANNVTITGLPTLMFAGQAVTLQAMLAPTPAVGVTVNVTATVAGVANLWQFTATGSTLQNFTFQAPDVPGTTPLKIPMRVNVSSSDPIGAPYAVNPPLPPSVSVLPIPPVHVDFPIQNVNSSIAFIATDPSRMNGGGVGVQYAPIRTLVFIDLTSLNLTIPIDPSFLFVASLSFSDGIVNPNQVVFDSTSAITGIYVNVIPSGVPPQLIGVTKSKVTINATPQMTIVMTPAVQSSSGSSTSGSNSKVFSILLPALLDKQVNDIFHSCDVSPCGSDGACRTAFSAVYNTSFTCVCSVGYEGLDCRSPIAQGARLNLLPQSNNLISYGGNSSDPCLTNSPCKNGGACQFNNGSFSCTCLTGFFSADCEFSVVACDGCVTSYSLANHSVTLLGTEFEHVVLLNVSGALLTKHDFTVSRMSYFSDTVQNLFTAHGGSDFWPTGLPIPDTFSVLNFTSPRLIRKNVSDNHETPQWVIQGYDRHGSAVGTDIRSWHTQAEHSSQSRKLTATTSSSISTSESNPPSTIMTSQFQPLTAVLQDSQASFSLSYPTLLWYSSSSCIAPGEFKPDGAGGCMACPQGALCPGGGRSYPLAGYWSPNEFTAPSKCKNSFACPGVDVKTVTSGTNAQIQTANCAAGYQGIRCETCADAYYNSAGSCQPCASNDANDAYFAIILIVAISVLILLSLAVCFLSASWLSAIICGLLVIQAGVAVGQSGVESLPASYQGLSRIFTILSVLNFDVEMFTPGCSAVPQLSFIGIFWATLVYAAISLVLFLSACYSRQFIMMYIRQRNKNKSSNKVEPMPKGHHKNESIELPDSAPIDAEASSGATGLSFESRRRIREDFRRRCIHAMIILGMLFYFKLTTLCMQGLHCVSDADGLAESESDTTAHASTYHLYSDPTVQCYSGNHIPTVILIFFLVIFYCFGFPFLCLVILTRVFASERTTGLVGWLFRNFKVFQPTEKDKKWTKNKYASDETADKDAAAIDDENNDDAAVVKKQKKKHLKFTKEFESLIEDCFGVMFDGLSDDHFFFRLTFILVQLFTAICTEYVTTDAISLRLFLLGLINAVETLVICVYLPFSNVTGNIRMAAVYWAEMTHCALMLGLQGSSLSDQGLQYFYTFLALYGFTCLVLIMRRQLSNWMSCCEIPFDMPEKASKSLDGGDDTAASDEIELAPNARIAWDQQQGDQPSDQPSTDNSASTKPQATTAETTQKSEPQSRQKSSEVVIRVDPSRRNDAAGGGNAETNNNSRSSSDGTNPAIVISPPATIASPSANNILETSEEDESLVPQSGLVTMLDLLVRANTIESDGSEDSEETDVVHYSMSLSSVASVLHAVSKLSSKLHKRAEATTLASTLHSISNDDSISSGLDAMRLAAACMIEQRLSEATKSGDATDVDYFSALYRQLVEAQVATSVHAESQRSAADAAMLERLKRGKPGKIQALIETALNNEAMLAVFRLEEEDRQRRCMEAKLQARKQKKQWSHQRSPSELNVTGSDDELTAEEEAAIESTLPLQSLALHNMLDELCREHMDVPPEAPTIDIAASALNLGLGVMVQSLRFAACCLIKRRIAAAEADANSDPAQTEYFTSLYRQLVSSTVATVTHASRERSAADDAMLQKLTRGKSKQASRLIEAALNNEAILDVFRLEEEDRQRKIMEAKLNAKFKRKTLPPLAAVDSKMSLPSPKLASSSPLAAPTKSKFLDSPSESSSSSPAGFKKNPSVLLQLTEKKRTVAPLPQSPPADVVAAASSVPRRTSLPPLMVRKPPGFEQELERAQLAATTEK